MSWRDDPVNRALACHMCGGAGYVEREGELGMPEQCPMCAAPMQGMTAYDVRWEASAKLFQVVLSFPLPEHPSTAQQLVGVLPQFIAERSRCSCGATLVLGDHKVSIDGMHGSFQGTFLCP